MDVSTDERRERIGNALERALDMAKKVYDKKGGVSDFQISKRFAEALAELSKQGSSANTGFTNAITGLAIKVAFPEIDVRYHQVQIQKPKLFSFRTESEKVVYPWLRDHDFDYAKSGWQTRTFERPKPYSLNYDENIGAIKESFLTVYDEVQKKNSQPIQGLAYILFLQMVARDNKKVDLIIPNIDDIRIISEFFENHFSWKYSGRGASRLPVLAIYALYKVVVPELKRFSGFDLKNLELHSAADSQTGAAGDIELAGKGGAIFEALEIKHGIPIVPALIDDVGKKLIKRNIARYYVLTTHPQCGNIPPVQTRIKEMRDRTGCQIIANGVVPTIRYYLRLVESPAAIFTYYTELLKSDKSIAHEHRDAWNKIVMGAS